MELELIDRIFLGYVVDYIHVSFFPPIFNFADCCVTVGTVLLMMHILFFLERKMGNSWKSMNNPEMRMGETLCIVAGPEDEDCVWTNFSPVRMEELTRSAAERLAEQGQVSSGGKILGKKYRLHRGMQSK